MLLEIVNCEVEVNHDVDYALCPGDKDLDMLRKGKDFVLPGSIAWKKDTGVIYEVGIAKPKYYGCKPKDPHKGLCPVMQGRVFHYGIIWIDAMHGTGCHKEMDVRMNGRDSIKASVPYPGDIVQAGLPRRIVQQVFLHLQQNLPKTLLKE